MMGGERKRENCRRDPRQWDQHRRGGMIAAKVGPEVTSMSPVAADFQIIEAKLLITAAAAAATRVQYTLSLMGVLTAATLQEQQP